jgi:hypothetical protein
LISFYIVVEETIFGVIFTFYGFRTAKNIGWAYNVRQTPKWIRRHILICTLLPTSYTFINRVAVKTTYAKSFIWYLSPLEGVSGSVSQLNLNFP